MHRRSVTRKERSVRCCRQVGGCTLVIYESVFILINVGLFQGKDLFMDLDEGALKLFDPENLTVLNTQPIHTIRVWGVGRDNGR